MLVRSLYSKIAFAILGMLTLTVAAVGVVNYLITKSQLEKSQKAEMEFYAEHFKNDITGILNTMRDRLRVIADGEQFVTYHENFRDIVLRKYFIKFSNEFPVLSYVNDDGEEEVKVVNGHASASLRDYANEKIFEDAMWNPNTVVMESFVRSDDLDEHALRFGLTRINYFGDEFSGMLVAHLPFSSFSKYLSSIRIGERGLASLISENGTLLARSRSGSDAHKISESDEFIAAVNGMKKGFLRSDILGIDSYVSFIPVEGTTWFILVSMPYDEFNALSDKLITAVMIIGAPIFFIVLLGASLVAKKIVDPIRDMEKASGDISRGNFTRRVKITSKDEIGEFANAFNVMMDKVNEFSESLLMEKKYIEKLMGSMMNAIIVMDRELNILELNESACQMLGYSGEELISRPLKMLMTEETESLLSRLIKDHSIRNEEKKLMKKNGDIIYTLISLSLVEDNEGSYDRVLCVAEDITGIKIAEELLRKSHDDMEFKVHERTAALVELNKELEEEIAERNRAEASLVRINEKLEMSNRELQEFAFIASHDLQEPLRKITTFGDRLRVKCAEGLGEQGNDYLQRMQSAAGRMHDLISSLLMFSRVTSRARPFDRVDLNIVASEVLSDLEVRIEQTGGKVELSALETIEADSFQMHQVLQNLISNALKFSKKDVPPVVKVYGKFIRGNGNGLEATESREMYQIIVEDNGIGFDEKYLEKIFGVFQRLHGRREYDGTGIGLSICRKILERHGGSITAESSPGNGASFIVTLPVYQTKKAVRKMNFAER